MHLNYQNKRINKRMENKNQLFNIMEPNLSLKNSIVNRIKREEIKAFLHSFVSDEIAVGNLTEYFKETKAELKHVNWPTRNQTIFYTLIVVVLSIAVAYFLGIFDFLFSQGLVKLISF